MLKEKIEDNEKCFFFGNLHNSHVMIQEVWNYNVFFDFKNFQVVGKYQKDKIFGTYMIGGDLVATISTFCLKSGERKRI